MTAKAFSFALLTLVALPAIAGCTASASFGSTGAASAAPPPPPPPPPPPAATAAPEATPAATTPAPAPAATTPAPAPAAAQQPSVTGNAILLPGKVEFETGKATFKAGGESEKTLEQLKLYLETTPRVTKLRVEGHTDNVGSASANETLSGERALTIKKFLVDKGINKTRLIAVGFGQNKPVADNTTEEGRAKNRRTEFRIAELSGKPYLGKDPTGGGKVFDF